ncbi:MAG: Histone deacetylase-like amidohydrolase [Alphaproteobacteria bacterium MarineAlpha2_Bin1]|nr:MAG: Histone deacetylase-like amidohydrolase [Alphaproteobacteria bacterium MarineAlpha2_Bin1]
MKTGIFFHPSFFWHHTGLNHPENNRRVQKIIKKLDDLNLDRLKKFDCPYATYEQIGKVHDKKYIDKIINFFPLKQSMQLDSDTLLSPRSLEACLRSPGAVISAIKMVEHKKIKNAFCVIRPPGHHARISQGMGFCIFNNIAIGAAYARDELDIKKIAIIDIDVHHGNGTEEWVRSSNDNNFLFFSIHQSPLYPGTGYESNFSETNVSNHILSPGEGSYEFRSLVKNRLIPKLESFKPKMILLSIGFDGHKLDDISDIKLLSEDYGWVTEVVCKIATKYCSGKLISVLEGGYNFRALEESSSNHVVALTKSDNI